MFEGAELRIKAEVTAESGFRFLTDKDAIFLIREIRHKI